MKNRFLFLKQILSIVICLALMIPHAPMMVYAVENTIYVSGTSGNDGNDGAENAPVKTIERALELVSEGGTIQIVDSASSEQPSADEPLCITKNVTITGGSLTLSKAGIVLGANATFQNISLNFINPVRNAIIVNGYTLNLNNLKGTGTYPVHLLCGGVTGYTGTLPVSGSEGAIIISGSDNNLGNICAGSFSEYGAENTWTGSSSITIAEGAGGVMGDVYAHGATEPRGEGDGSGIIPSSTDYTVTGDVTIKLSGSKPMAVYGMTGGNHNADVIFSGGANLVSGLSMNNVASLTVSAGTLQPALLSADVDLTIHSGAELDLSAVIEDGTVFSVGNFTGGGTLVMSQTDRLKITGTVTGTTAFQTADNRPYDKSTSGVAEYSYSYIDVTAAGGEGIFTFMPYFSQTGMTLEKVAGNDTVVWSTSAVPESSDVKPDSFDIPETSYTKTSEEMQWGLTVPVNCELAEEEMFSDIPLVITISKDGAPAITAEESYDEYGYLYSVPALGFEQIYGTWGDEDWVLCFYTDASTLEQGLYTINVSVVLSDDTMATKTITLSITNGEEGFGAELAGYTLSLNGNIGVNFYMELSDAIIQDEGAYMRFSLPDGTASQMKVTDAIKNTTLTEGKTYYVFSCEVASDEMTGNIKAQMFDGSGNCGTEYTYTVRDYAETIINHPDDYSEGAVAFAKALLNYGTYAQEYFNTATDDKANKNLEETDKAVTSRTAESLEEYKVSAVSHSALGKFAGCKLSLGSETTLKVYFEPAADVNDLTFSVNGQALSQPFVRSGKYIVLSVTDIKAWELDTIYEFAVSDGTSDMKIGCSAMSYCYSVLNDRETYSSALVNLVLALCDYQEKAEFYAPN